MSRTIANAEPCESGLRKNCLSFFDVLGQSVAGIAPSGTPAFTIPAVFILAGNGTWLAYLMATVTVLLVGLHINHFSKRNASSGALYTFVTDGMGAGSGFVAGSALVMAYLLTAAAILPLFANFANVILSAFHLPPVSGILLCVLCAVSAWFVVQKNVVVSAKLMLIIESISISLMIVLAVIIFIKTDFTVFTQVLSTKGIGFDSIRLGLVLAFFSFIGFESASALGQEAKKPLKNIPKAILISAAFVGVFFTLFSVLEIAGFMSAGLDLAASTSPLNDLAVFDGVGIFGLLISMLAFTSFWSCVVACITASSRIIYSMGQQNLVPKALSKVHGKNETPHVAASLVTILALVIPIILLSTGIEPMMIFSYVGTIATYGFLLSYMLVVVAAPFYLKRRGELKTWHVVLSVIACGILLVPLVGSIYPLPPFPFNIFPLIFLSWVILSLIWYAFKHRKTEGKKIVAALPQEE